MTNQHLRGEHARRAQSHFSFIGTGSPHHLSRRDCGNPLECGRRATVFTVPEDGDGSFDSGDVYCDASPLRPDEERSYVSFSGHIYNEIWTP